MIKKLLLPVLLFCVLGTSAQLNNSWIDYSKTYYKFKNGEDKLCRISQTTLIAAGVPAATNADHYQLWRNGEQVRLYTSISAAPLGTSDYIEFWGEKNNGKPDKQLYKKPEFQLADKYSLETDTSTYFLTVNPAGGNLRFANTANPSPGATAPDAYFMRSIDIYYNSQINRGFGKDYGEYVHSAAYDDGEGFTSGEITATVAAPVITYTENFSGLNVYTAGPANSVSVRSNLYFNTDNSTRNISIKLGTNEVFNETSSIVKSTIANVINLPLTYLSNPSSNPLSFTLTNPAPSTGQPNDRMVIATSGITYPATFNFNNEKSFYFDLGASATGNYLLIDNFNYGATAPVLYDMNTGRRYTGDIASTPGKVKFVLAASADVLRRFRLVNMEASNIAAVNTIASKTFINYNTAATRGDYIIISNPRLYNDGAGNNFVDQYRQYRSSANGGSYNAKIYDINELTDQFGFGIKKHPAAVRDFVRFIDQQYPVKPKFVFLIGRGMTYIDQRVNESNPLSESLDLVQSFGWPASDNLLVSQPGSVIPIIPVGRLAAVNGTEVNYYLQKIQQYEQTQRTQSPLIADKAWMKNGMHVVGGKTAEESALFLYYMNTYRDIAQDSLFGGKVETFVKTSVSTVQQASSERISQLFQEGLGFLGYFGHSSANVFEFNLSDPAVYNSTGKYPFINVSGCSAGNFYVFDPARLTGNLTLSEKYVLNNQKGSIGFLADSHFGVPPTLNIYNTAFYTAFSRNMYGQPVGNQIKDVIASIGGADPDLDYLPRIHIEEINLHGDPAVKINNFAKPDYAIEDQSVKISPAIISVADASFKVKIMMNNLGRATHDSIKVYVKRLLPNTTVPVTIYDKLIPAPKNLDSLELTVPINPVTDKGQNSLIIELDYTFRVSELYETNNKITKSFFIFEDELRPIYPYDYAIVNNSNITFSASTANPLVGLKNYVMEIDTTQLFNSPFKKSYSASGPGGLIQFTPSNITYTDSAVYYWRTAVVPATGSNYIWNGMSFIYLPASTPGFNQSHYFQYLKNSFNTEVLGNDRVFRFTPKTADYVVRTAIFPFAGQTDEFSLSNSGFIEQAGFYAPYFNADNEVLRFYVIDSLTLKPWKCVPNATNTAGTYGSYLPTPINSSVLPGFFHFDISTPAARQTVVNFLNIIPQGNFVVLSNCPGQNFTHFPAEWATDPGNNLSAVLTGMGFTTLNQLTTHKPFVFVTRKGSNTAAVQIFGINASEKLSVPFVMTSVELKGDHTSDVFGPAKKWNALHVRGNSLETPTADTYPVQIIGLNISGSEDLLAIVSPSQDTALNWINAVTYPRLKLKMLNEDSVKATPYQLRYWRINADLVPEGAVAPNLVYTMKDSVDAGEPINFSLAFKNISPVKFDSLIKVKFLVTDNNNITNNVAIPPRKALVSNDTLMVSYTIDTRNLAGNNTLSVEFNPDNHQPEQFHFNNVLYKTFYVRSDKFNPLLDVTFDGVHILNRDLVASRPNILVKLKDENRFLALKDTSLMKVQVRYPNGSLHNYFFNGDTMRFIPANLSAGENTASIELKPYFPEDGDYELLVTGKDVSGNAAGDLNYHISFTVINTPMISNMLNYPNPFTTSTAFVFTLTGSEVPQNMRIQILTITGKVVREITKDELGPIHIGRNITEFKWDGTDQYGQKLANGVYIYRVLTNLNGKSLDKYKEGSKETDKFFNKGYGKMYLMR